MPTYRFDNFEYDTGSFRLNGPGGDISLEPKVAELLALLIRHQDRVVSRSEIFDILWPNQEVGDAALSRLLYELRKALNDEATNPKLLRTVPRRGLQFVGAARELAVPPRSESSNTQSKPRPEPNPVSRAPVLVALVLAAGLAITLILNLSTDRSETPEIESSRFAILTDVSAGADSRASMVMVTVSDLLWGRLSSLPTVEVRSPFFVEATSSEATSLVAFARESEVDYVLSLSAEPTISPDWVSIKGELIQIRGTDEPWRTPLSTIELPIPSSDQDLLSFLNARDQLVQRVAEQIGVLVNPSEVGSAPQKLEAWQLYLRARAQLELLQCDTDGAASLLQRAVELDSGFGAAWLLLGFAHYNQVWACGEGRTSALQALAASQKARELDSGIPGVVFLESTLLSELGQADAAITLAREYLDGQSGSAAVMAGLAYSLTYRGQLDEAGRLIEAAVAIDPLILAVETGVMPTVFLHQGRWEQYLTMGPAGDSPIQRYYRAYANWHLGNQHEARRLTDGCQSNAKAEVFSGFCQALGFILREEPEKAITVLQALLMQRQTHDAVDGEIDFKIAQLLAAANANESALQAAELAWQRGFQCSSCFDSDPLLASLRSSDRWASEYARIFAPAP